jgi:hypothetical protein
MNFKSAVLIFIRYINNSPNVQKTKHIFLSFHLVIIYKLLINLQFYLPKFITNKYSNPLVYRLDSFLEHCSYHEKSLRLCSADDSTESYSQMHFARYT